MLRIQVLFSIAHLEEVFIFTTSKWIVLVVSHGNALINEWLLDVPEGVSWNRFEDSVLQGFFKALAVGMLQITDKVVLFIVLKGCQLLIKGLSQELSVDITSLSRYLLQHVRHDFWVLWVEVHHFDLFGVVIV